MPAVEVVDLRKRYGAVTALDGVTLDAEPAAITAVLGPNGAGKTTTVEICCGLRSRDAGTVSVLGLDPARDAAELHHRVGVMPQAGGSSASGVYPSARVGEVLDLYAALYAHPLTSGQLLERLGLTRVARSPWRRLSGGEQQRLSLALAVVGRPEIVFLDEPTAGLDVAARHAAWELLRDLRGAGVAILLTTHAMDEAEELADSVVIIDRGRVVASGAPKDLTADRAGGLLTFAAPPGLDLSTLQLDGATCRETGPGRYEVRGAVGPALAAAVTAWCADQGVMPDRLSAGARSLEDVFLEVTGRPAP